jgi:hypothetical protein
LSLWQTNTNRISKVCLKARRNVSMCFQQLVCFKTGLAFLFW